METKEKRPLLDRMSWFLTRHRIPVLGFLLLLTAIFAYGSLRIRSGVVLQEMLPYNHPYVKIQARFAKDFGTGSSTVAIALVQKHGTIFNVKTLTKLKKLTEDVKMLNQVYPLLTVSIASESTKVVQARARGNIQISDLMYPNVPQTKQQMEQLKKNIYSNPAYYGTLVSKDGKAALILTQFKENISYFKVFKILRRLQKKYTDNETSVHIVGYPMLMGWVYSLRPQMYMVFAISIAAIALVLWIIFLNIPGMISPLVNAFILTIWGLGFIGFAGINFSPLLYVLAFLVGARMIGNSHQIAYRYFEELNSSGGNREQACYETMRTMFIPNFAAVMADVAGFIVLFVVEIALMQHLAVIMSFWMLTILLTGFMVPAVCSLIPLEVASREWAKESCQLDWKARVMMAMTRFSIAPRTKYLTGALVVLLAVFCAYQTTKLKIGDPTPGSPLFYANFPYNKDTALINKKFNASSDNLTLFYGGARGSVYDPAVLRTFNQFRLYMADHLPDIYKSSNSVIDLASLVDFTLHDGDPVWYQLPSHQKLLVGLMGYVRWTDQAAMRCYMDTLKLSKTQIMLYFSDHTSDNLLRIRNAAYNFFKTHPMKTKEGRFYLAGGSIGMDIALNAEMKDTHFIIDLLVYTGIFLLCALSFRSITAGLMLTLPLVLANIVNYAYMSLTGIGLSINTLPVAAVGAGLGVDFAIYLYSRAMEEFPIQNGDWEATIIQSICTCGKAVVYTGVTVILPILTWYFFSSMKFQAEVGFFLSIIMAINVVFCLTLHPLLLYIVKPKFISRTLKEANSIELPASRWDEGIRSTGLVVEKEQ